MFSETDASRSIGTTAVDSNDDKVGKVGQVFLDDNTGAPEFLTVNTGLFGTSESFVPTQGATFDGETVRLGYDKATVKDAPHVELDDGHLSPDEESRLYEYYGMGVGDPSGQPTTTTDTTHDADAGAPAAAVAPQGHDTSGPNTDDAMTRSEEHLEAGTTSGESGRARLRKYVTTEQETVTVPVRKERAVLESEPITSANADQAGSGAAISEEEHEVVLHEEHAVVEAVATPVERVRLGKETVVEDESVTEDVRSEQIEVDGDVDGGTTTR